MYVSTTPDLLSSHRYFLSAFFLVTILLELLYFKLSGQLVCQRRQASDRSSARPTSKQDPPTCLGDTSLVADCRRWGAALGRHSVYGLPSRGRTLAMEWEAVSICFQDAERTYSGQVHPPTLPQVSSFLCQAWSCTGFSRLWGCSKRGVHIVIGRAGPPTRALRGHALGTGPHERRGGLPWRKVCTRQFERS